ncbi:nitrogenase component 1 [Oceanotoga teriensis]|uniref:Nitrogenase molybdenum-iron protein alpha/beta subunit n=1 Tax=Oceanotoga teriensis TaxID=515440 RepID=A0AA45HJ09_9BACT|nr:nitrogenase component 1 [Oceanotoga teriensis]MDO7976778.1 nitrogenase component 1 [Oceanotoga teriensis]PWJ95287.1 nitrogenase molybdenum-iron protein alpha/beta subunit [Oceanotoga teriensis]
MNEFSHLNKLSKVNSNRGVKFLTPAVHNGSHCPMHRASIIAENIKGLSTLLVGMPECTIHSRLFSPNPEGENNEFHWLYVLNSNEVVFGCRQGIIDSLKKMDKLGSKAILVILTCVPELIGEDMEGILEEINHEIDAKVSFIMLGQFKHISFPSGSWKTMEAMHKLMLKKEQKNNQVNLLGVSLDGHSSIPLLVSELKKIDANIRYLSPDSSLYDFQNSTDSVLNIVFSPYMKPLAIKMYEEFKIPYISLHDIYDIKSIDDAYNKISKYFNFDLNSFNSLRKESLKIEKEAKKKLKDLSFILSLRIDLPIPLGIYLTELGMIPLLFHIEEFYNHDKEDSNKLFSMGVDPFICKITNIDSDIEIIKKLNFDMCFGYIPYNQNIPNIGNMFDFYGQVGYERTLNLLNRILKVYDAIKGGFYNGIA